MTPLVRSATPADLPGVLELLHLKAEFDQCPAALQATQEALAAAWFANPPLAGALVAARDGRLVGLATYFQTFSSFLAKPGFWLDDLFVREECRSQRIGEQLLSELSRLALERGCHRIEWTVALSNSRGIAFYERHLASVKQASRFVRLSREGIEKLAARQ